MDNHRKFLFASIIGLSLGMILCVGVFKIESTLACGAISLVISTIFACVYLSITDKQTKSDSSIISYDKESQTLHLYQRCEKAKKYVILKEYIHYNYNYHPEKTIYTGATVGGISMGGFHTEEAHYTVGSGSKTGVFDFYYNDRFDGCENNIITHIECHFKAPNSGVFNKLMINNNTITLEYKNASKKKTMLDYAEPEMIDNMVATNDLKNMAILTKDKIITKKLNYKDASALIDWIGGSTIE